MKLDRALTDSIISDLNRISYTTARENLASTIDQVCANHSLVIIPRNRNQSVVMLSLADDESLEESANLMRSPANTKRLLQGIEALESVHGLVREVNLDA
jgi:antitoxin YefM